MILTSTLEVGRIMDQSSRLYYEIDGNRVKSKKGGFMLIMLGEATISPYSSAF